MAQVNESMLEPIRIKDDGRMVLLDYASFLAYHGGGALAGATIGFRAMACAAVALSPTELWDRKDLSVTTQHGGLGVRDAIEFVTRCVTRGRFRLDERTERDGPCMSPATFQFAGHRWPATGTRCVAHRRVDASILRRGGAVRGR